MKKLFYSLIAAFILLPAVVFAADIRTGETIGENEKTENPYIAGENVTVDANVGKDLTAAGGNVTVNGDVENSALLAGGTIFLKGKVGQNARVAGGTVTIDGDIEDDLLIFGGQINVGSGSKIGGDVIVFGGNVNLNGEISGKVIGSGGTVTINGPVDGNIELKGVGDLVLTENAVVGGDLIYSSQREAEVRSGAKVKGETKFEQTKAKEVGKNFAKGISTWAILLGLVGSFVTILILTLVAPKTARTLVEQAYATPMANIGIGFIFLVVVPFAILVALISVLGISLAALTALFYFVTIVIASILSTLLVGTLAKKLVTKKEIYEIDWIAILSGVVIVALLKLIPILGWLALFGFFLLALGALVRSLSGYLKTERALKKS